MTTIIILAVVIAIAITIVRLLPKSSCTGDCNQGRNCTCRSK
jgi:hypothetical protein